MCVCVCVCMQVSQAAVEAVVEAGRDVAAPRRRWAGGGPDGEGLRLRALLEWLSALQDSQVSHPVALCPQCP